MDLLQRDFELGELDHAVTRAAGGSGLVVLVRGVAGIGKSALLRAFVDRCRDEVHLLVGACDDLLTPTPLEPFWDMVEDEPRIRDALVDEDSQALFSELSSLMTRKTRPTVIVIDDIHWSDQATLDVIRRISRRIDRTHGLLVLAFRDEDTLSEHPLRMVIGDVPPRSMLRLKLGALEREAIARLGGQDRADELLHLTGGNPLLVTEMIRSDREVPSSVFDLVVGRLNRLPPVSRSIVELVSMLPGHCDLHLAKSCLVFDLEDLKACEQSGLLAVTPEKLSFRHELIRRAVEGSLSESARIDLNARLLAALESQGADESRLVHHALQAGNIDALIRYAPLAARTAASAGSRREAAAHYRSIEPHLDRYPPTERAGLLEDWSVIEDQLGMIAKAQDLRLAALDLYREMDNPIASARCQVPLSILLWRMRQPEEALRNAAESVTILETEAAPPDDLAIAYARHAYIRTLNGDFEEAMSAAASARQAASKTDDPRLIVEAMAAEVLSTFEDWRDGREALATAERAGLTAVAANLYSSLVQVDSTTHPSKRDNILTRALDFADTHQLDDLRCFAVLAFSERHLQAGRFSDAEDDARVAAAIWSDTDQNLAVWPLSNIALAQVRRGAPQAGETIRQVFEIPDSYPPLIAGVQVILAEAHWLNPLSPFDPESAFAEHRFCQRLGGWDSQDSALVFWMWKLGLLTEYPEELHPNFRLHIEGNWERAATEWADWGRPYERALALADGTVEARLEALSILDGLGAVPLATRIRKQLRAEGVKAVPLGPRPTTRDHAALLTTRQSEVLDLMAEGLTNSEIADTLFISSRTAEHHVAAILSKLNATSREEAVVMAETAGLLQPV